MSNNSLQLRISIFDALEPVLLRSTVTVEQLLQDILREFRNELDLNQRYGLFYNGQSLPLSAAFGVLEIPADSIISLNYRAGNLVQESPIKSVVPTDGNKSAIHLRDLRTGKVFAIQSLPALIGRYSQRDQQIVDVDLSELPGADTVSRRHARLTFSDNSYFITRLENSNLLTINGFELAAGVIHPLSKADLVDLGEVKLQFDSNEPK